MSQRSVRSYRDLHAWQQAIELVELVYAASSTWPHAEQFGLTGQVRRAAISIPSNIAEGQGRGAGKEFVHHLRIARGSLYEVETQLYIAHRIGYLDRNSADQMFEKIADVGRLINGLARSLRDHS